MPGRRRHEPPHVAAPHLVVAALHLARLAERTLAAHEPPLTIAQFLTLRGVADGVSAPGELAARAAVSDAATSQLIRGLEQAGLVASEIASDDRRRHHLRLTPSGTRCLHSADELLQRSIAGVLGEIHGPDAERLADLLARVAGIAEGTPPPRRPPPPPRPHAPRARS